MHKELMTASRMNTLLSCPRKHYWRYEVGMSRVTDAAALRFGTAWHAAMEARLLKAGPAAPFTLPPEAVLKRVIHALESPRPQARYPVTVPTYLFTALRRLLPTRVLDVILWRVGGDGRR